MTKFMTVNVKANLKNMKSRSKYVDLKDGDSKIFRLLPPVVGSEGVIFHLTHQHWNLKDDAGGGIALANLGVHGNDETGREDYIEKLIDALNTIGGTLYKKLAKSLKPNDKYYAQGFEGILQEDGSIEWEQKVKFFSTCKTVAKAVMKIIETQNSFKTPNLTDFDKGEAIVVSRTGSGLQDTKYDVQRHGVQLALEDIVPGGVEKAKSMDEISAFLGLKILNPEQQKAIVKKYSYPDLDWDVLENEYGL